MPARTYRIALINQVPAPIPLKLISANTKEGGWTQGPWYPPSNIDQNSQRAGQWQSESTDFPLHGTEASVVYQIEDKMVNFNLDPQAMTPQQLQPGKGNQITIHWSNPAIGAPNVPDVSYASAGDIYVVKLVSLTSGGQNEIPDLGLAPVPGAIIGSGGLVGAVTGIIAAGAALAGEDDTPFAVLALQLVSPDITVVSFSLRRAFQGTDLSLGIRRLRPGGGSISLRNLMDI